MTNEQAIKVLLDEWKCIDRNDGINCDRKCEQCDLVMDSAILKDAYNTAIKALSQEPCEDAVSRDAVDDILCLYSDKSGMIDARGAVRMVRELPSVTQKSIECDDAISREWLMRKATERFYTTNYFNHISAMIEEAPSVTQKSGKWIKDECGNVICSECKRFRRDNRYGHTNYCNHCGARMESEEEQCGK